MTKFENIAFAIVLRVKKIAKISDSLKTYIVGIFLVGCSGVWRYLLTDKGMPTFLRWVSVTTASRVLQRYRVLT